MLREIYNLQMISSSLMPDLKVSLVNCIFQWALALAIYARENGDGVMFEPEEVYDELNSEPDTEQPTSFHEVVDSPRKREEKKENKISFPFKNC